MRRVSIVFSLVLAGVFLCDFSARTQTLSPQTPAAHYTYGENIRLRGVPRSAKVSEHLYRGAQPGDPGLRELKNIGITTIVDLRAEDRSKIAWEQKAAESLGMHFVSIPVGGWSTPSDAQVAQFLAIFREHPDEKVFVHCHFGEDRTGVFVAAYRMAYDKFPSSEALKEMNRFGFNWAWHPSMITYVRNFPQILGSSPALASFKQAD